MILKKNKNLIKAAYNALFVIVYSLLYFLTIILFYHNNTEFDYGVRGYIVLIVFYMFILINMFNVFGSFKLGNKRISDIALSNIFSLFFTDFLAYFVLGLIEGHLVLVLPHIAMFIIQCIFGIWFALVGNKAVRENIPPQKTLLIYGNNDYETIYKKLVTYQKYEFNIEKCVYEKDINYRKIYDLISQYECIITSEIKHDNKKKIAKECYKENISVYDVPSIIDVLTKSSEVLNLIDTPLFKLNKMGPNILEKFIKRIVDVFGAIVLLVLSSPIMLVSAIIIKAQDGGSVFFKQKRLTTNGKEFNLIKFRSMIMNAEPDGIAIRAKKDDDRITPFGKFMRSTRIDELPQIFNILAGALSFVGPRALRVEEYKQNEKDFPEFAFRLKVKAGLSGYAQVYGKYNTSFRDKLLLDMYYIENYSLIIDFKLIMMTFITVFSKDSTEGF